MNSDPRKKLAALKSLLASYGRAVVALSGGTDSSFLLAVSSEIMGDRVVGLTVDSPFTSREEIRAAASVASKLGVDHTMLHADPLSSDIIAGNDEYRCYHCKKFIFGAIREFARSKSIDAVLDGSNYDDTGDYRPGARALSELGIISPLRDAELTKDEIRSLAKSMGVETWDRPSSSCLAARIPYGHRITPRALEMIEAAEIALRDLGFCQVRVRHHDTIARIEVLPADIARAADTITRKTIVNELKKIGYTYVSLDLEGYRTGSLNEPLNRGD